MALRREDLTQSSWSTSGHWIDPGPRRSGGLAEPEFRAYLEDSIRRLDSKEPAALLTREEFLAQTTTLDE